MKKIISVLEDFLVWQVYAILGVLAISEAISVMIHNPYTNLPLGAFGTGAILIMFGLFSFWWAIYLKKFPYKKES